jgi:hypothetical protein
MAADPQAVSEIERLLRRWAKSKQLMIELTVSHDETDTLNIPLRKRMWKATDLWLHCFIVTAAVRLFFVETRHMQAFHQVNANRLSSAT